MVILQDSYQKSEKSQDLYAKLEKNLMFHVLVEKIVQETQYGNVTFNIRLKDGVVDLQSLNIVRNKRIKYNI